MYKKITRQARQSTQRATRTEIRPQVNPPAPTHNQGHVNIAIQRIQQGNGHAIQMRKDILTLQSTPGNRAVVQPLARVQKIENTHNTSSAIHAIASAGVHGTGNKLPYYDKTQAAFGRHNISHVRAYMGNQARAASRAIGAEAYATENKIAFASSKPSLHTVAHEATHIIQQRAGVSLKGGVGQVGDVYEQQADAVADAVVKGKSAESLLSAYAQKSFTGITNSRQVQGKLILDKNPVESPDMFDVDHLVSEIEEQFQIKVSKKNVWEYINELINDELTYTVYSSKQGFAILINYLKERHENLPDAKSKLLTHSSDKEESLDTIQIRIQTTDKTEPEFVEATKFAGVDIKSEDKVFYLLPEDKRVWAIARKGTIEWEYLALDQIAKHGIKTVLAGEMVTVWINEEKTDAYPMYWVDGGISSKSNNSKFLAQLISCRNNKNTLEDIDRLKKLGNILDVLDFQAIIDPNSGHIYVNDPRGIGNPSQKGFIAKKLLEWEQAIFSTSTEPVNESTEPVSETIFRTNNMGKSISQRGTSSQGNESRVIFSRDSVHTDFPLKTSWYIVTIGLQGDVFVDRVGKRWKLLKSAHKTSESYDMQELDKGPRGNFSEPESNFIDHPPDNIVMYSKESIIHDFSPEIFRRILTIGTKGEIFTDKEGKRWKLFGNNQMCTVFYMDRLS